MARRAPLASFICYFTLFHCGICILDNNFKLGATLFPREPLQLTDSQLKILKEQSHSFNGLTLANSTDNEVPCGLSNFTKRIIGGSEAGVNEFPWQAWLLIYYYDEWFKCGGSLINSQWVLTAAHCVDGALEAYVLLGSHHNDLELEEPNRRIYITETFVIHPDWNDQTLAGDLALIKLPDPISFDDYVRPICLGPANDSSHVGDLAVISGWGISSDDGPISPVLRKTQVTVMNQTSCQQVYGSIITSKIICTSGAEGHGTCDGDSGGPVSYVNNDGTYTQIGIVSFGSSSGCESRQPDGHSRISSYRNWISITSKSSNLLSSVRLIVLIIVYSFF